MRILFLTQVLPYPLDAGPKVRAYYTLRHLAMRNDATLVSFVRESDTQSAVDHLRKFCSGVHGVPIRRSRTRDAWYLLRSLTKDVPFVITRDWSPAMAGMISRVISECGPFDAVHADQLWMAAYGLLARSMHPPSDRPFIVLDQHNAAYQIPKRMAASAGSFLNRRLLLLEASKLARYEVRSCREFDELVFVTEEDRGALRACGLGDDMEARTRVIPISIQPQSAHISRSDRIGRRVTFMGVLRWPPNAEGALWYERFVWPVVSGAVPDARFTVIGRDPPAVLGKSDPDSIEIAGYVADPDRYLRETAVFVVPLLAGGGMRVKILEAWAKGLPVVSTTIGAEGLRVADGENILLADRPAEFARHVIRLLQDPEFAAGLARQGRRTVEAHYDWREVYPAWDEVYECASCSSLRMLPA